MEQAEILNYSEPGEKQGLFKKIAIIFELIKFSHTIFSLPFVIMSAFLAAGGVPSIRKLIIIVLAVTMARSCAMAFNRLVDTRFDEQNERTAYRVTHQKLVGQPFMWVFAIGSALLFVLFAGMLNKLSLMLSPIALVLVFGYSYTKRFTDASHFVLGAALGLAPIGAWIGIRGESGVPAFIIGIAVLLWTAGFDIIYSCQDYEHDKRMGLFSVPKRFGIKSALKISTGLHILMVVFLFLLFRYTALSYIYLAGVCVVMALLIYEHSLVKPTDLTKINVAFFNINGVISIGLTVMTIIDIFVFK